MSDSDDLTPVAEAEAPEQVSEPVSVPQTGSSSAHGNGWFKRAVRSGIIAAIVVVVAGAFFTIGWFTSTRGEDERSSMMGGINQQENMREWSGSRGGADQRGTDQRQPDSGRRGAMTEPRQGQSPNQTVPAAPSEPDSQSSLQGYLGVGVKTVTPELQRQFGLSRSDGALVASVDANGPAVLAGIQQGDIITSIDGASVTQQADVVNLVAKKKAGDSVSVTVDRNGSGLTLQVTLTGRPASITG